MRIEGFMAAYSPDASRSSASTRSTKDRTAAGTNSKVSKDSVEISAEARKRLERVKSRINRGFYNSDSVAEDISDKLGGVLDDITK